MPLKGMSVTTVSDNELAYPSPACGIIIMRLHNSDPALFDVMSPLNQSSL